MLSTYLLYNKSHGGSFSILCNKNFLVRENEVTNKKFKERDKDKKSRLPSYDHHPKLIKYLSTHWSLKYSLDITNLFYHCKERFFNMYVRTYMYHWIMFAHLQEKLVNLYGHNFHEKKLDFFWSTCHCWCKFLLFFFGHWPIFTCKFLILIDIFFIGWCKSSGTIY